MIEKCQIKGCKGIASNHLKIEDKSVCVDCYCGLTEVDCQKNNCGNPAINKNDAGIFVCEEHQDSMRAYGDSFGDWTK